MRPDGRGKNMIELKSKSKEIKNAVAATQIISVAEGTGMRLMEIIRSDEKNYIRFLTDENETVKILEDDPAAFTEGFLALEGAPKSLGIRFTCSENAAWVVWALAELKKRIYLQSLLKGEREMEILSNPEGALRGVADIAFLEKTDFRMLMPFMQQYLQKAVTPDLDAAFQELKENNFIIEKTGALSMGGAAIVTALSFIHAMIAVDSLQEKEGKQVLTSAVYMNCYHSVWLMCPPRKDSPMLLCTVGREELEKDLKSLYEVYR